MADFLTATRGAPAHPSLLRALEFWLAAPGTALDLGCGAGRDSLHLLGCGWQVVALDQDPAALACLQDQAGTQARLTTRCQAFEDPQPLPEADLINASFALPFCAPAEFSALWARIQRALRAGGLFCGHFFGPRDDWAAGPLSILEIDEVRRLFASWQTLRLEEFEWEGRTAVGRSKHWHLLEVIARRI